MQGKAKLSNARQRQGEAARSKAVAKARLCIAKQWQRQSVVLHCGSAAMRCNAEQCKGKAMRCNAVAKPRLGIVKLGAKQAKEMNCLEMQWQ